MFFHYYVKKIFLTHISSSTHGKETWFFTVFFHNLSPQYKVHSLQTRQIDNLACVIIAIVIVTQTDKDDLKIIERIHTHLGFSKNILILKSSYLKNFSNHKSLESVTYLEVLIFLLLTQC